MNHAETPAPLSKLLMVQAFSFRSNRTVKMKFWLFLADDEDHGNKMAHEVSQQALGQEDRG